MTEPNQNQEKEMIKRITRRDSVRVFRDPGPPVAAIHGQSSPRKSIERAATLPAIVIGLASSTQSVGLTSPHPSPPLSLSASNTVMEKLVDEPCPDEGDVIMASAREIDSSMILETYVNRGIVLNDGGGGDRDGEYNYQTSMADYDEEGREEMEEEEDGGSPINETTVVLPFDATESHATSSHQQSASPSPISGHVSSAALPVISPAASPDQPDRQSYRSPLPLSSSADDKHDRDQHDDRDTAVSDHSANEEEEEGEGSPILPPRHRRHPIDPELSTGPPSSEDDLAYATRTQFALSDLSVDTRTREKKRQGNREEESEAIRESKTEVGKGMTASRMTTSKGKEKERRTGGGQIMSTPLICDEDEESDDEKGLRSATLVSAATFAHTRRGVVRLHVVSRLHCRRDGRRRARIRRRRRRHWQEWAI